jgi:hypothetical protein
MAMLKVHHLTGLGPLLLVEGGIGNLRISGHLSSGA